MIIKHARRTYIHFWIQCQPPVPPVQNYDTETHLEPTSHPPNKSSKVNWMFQKIICLGDEYIFKIFNRK